jgi:YrbI family 3-deoxy-D-manno-octulosonate 8-phosphate phosphatase
MIKLFITDVDGTLTDGSVMYTEHGEESITFNRKDGLGFRYLKEKNIPVMFLSGEDNGAIRTRIDKLGVEYHLLGVEDKKERLTKFLFQQQIEWKDVAYIGDDVNDLDCLAKVGYPACPADAAYSVTQIPNIYVCGTDGGKGAVREFIEYLLVLMDKRQQRRSTVGQGRDY